MPKYIIFSFLFFALSLSAKILISPFDAMHLAYPKATSVKKENILISKKHAINISNFAQVKLDSKIFRIYKAFHKDSLLGYGILIKQKVRSKNSVILYFINSSSVLLGIEVIAFNEPLEYLPSKMWDSQFKNIDTNTMLHISKNIPTISGATLSARSTTKGSRIAFAFYKEILKNKQ